MVAQRVKAVGTKLIFLLRRHMDVYQWFLMISTHSQRHILQIREIKAHGVSRALRREA